jgi:hypothetical protein
VHLPARAEVIDLVVWGGACGSTWLVSSVRIFLVPYCLWRFLLPLARPLLSAAWHEAQLGVVHAAELGVVHARLQEALARKDTTRNTRSPIHHPLACYLLPCRKHEVALAVCRMSIHSRDIPPDL